MASKAKQDGEVGPGGKHAKKFKKDQVLDDDWYWKKFPDLFEQVPDKPKKTEKKLKIGDTVPEGGES